jgi:hypothetical protein
MAIARNGMPVCYRLCIDTNSIGRGLFFRVGCRLLEQGQVTSANAVVCYLPLLLFKHFNRTKQAPKKLA